MRVQAQRGFALSARRTAAADVDAHDPHHEESFEEFTARYVAWDVCRQGRRK
jgi:hypothetical protein